MQDNQVTITQNVAILIDGYNIGIGIQQEMNDPTRMVDYDRVIPKVLLGRGLKKFYFFREGTSISEKFTKRLQEKYFGITVLCKKSVDLELAMTAIELADKVDTIILFSGDKDFIPLVRRLKTRGVRVEIAGVFSSTSKELVDEADFYFKITGEDSFSYNRKITQPA